MFLLYLFHYCSPSLPISKALYYQLDLERTAKITKYVQYGTYHAATVQGQNSAGFSNVFFIVSMECSMFQEQQDPSRREEDPTPRTAGSGSTIARSPATEHQ